MIWAMLGAIVGLWLATHTRIQKLENGTYVTISLPLKFHIVLTRWP